VGRTCEAPEGDCEWSVGSSSALRVQCAEQKEAPYEYILAYQEGDLSKHYQATDDAVPLDRVISTFIKYLRGDESWKSDFKWRRIEL
jgi:hypothetical protein